MPAYVVAMMTVHDPEMYSKYAAQTPPLVEKHGGKFLTRGEPISNQEDTTYDGRMVLLEFPSTAHADAWIHDPDYAEVAKVRQAASTMHHLMLQEGTDSPAAPDPKV